MHAGNEGGFMADIDDLKTATAQVVEAMNSRNLEAFAANLHDEVTFFLPTSPFWLDGKAAVRESYRGMFANSEETSLSLINPHHRVIGATGLAWGHLAITVKPKDGPLTRNFLRFTWAFAKEGGKWLRVATHLSRIPSGN
jgi:ketosteroid isomerase-like protein